MCARFTVLSDTPIAAAIAGCVIPLSRNSTIWMRWRCAAGIFHRSAVFSRRTSALLHLTICFPPNQMAQANHSLGTKNNSPSSLCRLKSSIQAVIEVVQDRDGGILLLATLFGMYPFLKKLFADGGYQGPDFQKALAKILPQLETEIVKRSDRTRGFVVLPRRWVVERTFAWLNRCRRLAKDWENLNRNALAFLRLASIRLMLRKLCNPA